jgi:hypothetical protein
VSAASPRAQLVQPAADPGGVTIEHADQQGVLVHRWATAVGESASVLAVLAGSLISALASTR